MVEEDHELSLVEVRRRVGDLVERGQSREHVAGAGHELTEPRRVECRTTLGDIEPPPCRLVVPSAQSGGAETPYQHAAVDHLCAQVDRTRSIDGFDVVVITLETEPTLPDPAGEVVEFVVRLVTDQVSPARAAPLPGGSVDEHGHARTVPAVSQARSRPSVST